MFFDGSGNVMNGKQNTEHYAATEQYVESNDAAKSEHEAEPNKEECRRPKREINKPYYLKDFVNK